MSDVAPQEERRINREEMWGRRGPRRLGPAELTLLALADAKLREQEKGARSDTDEPPF